VLLISTTFLVPLAAFAQFTNLFTENFDACGEGLVPICGWNTSGSGSPWTTTNNSCAIAGVYSLSIGSDATYCEYNRDFGTSNRIAYKGFSSSGYQLLDITFNWKCVGQTSFDYGKVVYSVDGLTWTDVSGTQYVNQAVTAAVNNLSIPAGINNDPTVFIGFRWFDNTNTGGFPGFVVDDVIIRGEQMTPASPSNPTSNSPQCGNVTITRTGAPPSPSNVVWYWQGTSCGTSMLLGSGATFIAIPSGTYYIRAYNTVSGLWSPGCGSITIVSDSPMPVANAGTGGDKCDLAFNFAATPSIGSGVWTQQSGSGTSSFSPNANDPNAIVTVSLYDTYVFRWTETNGSCIDFSEITVNFYQQPIANPGVGSTECDLNFTFSATPSVGAGIWTQITGPGVSSFVPSANSPAATVTVNAYGIYTYRWSEVNGTCSDFSDVVVVYEEQPVTSAGPNSDECILTHILAAIPSVGTGLWTMQSGPGTISYFPNASSPTAFATASAYGTYILRWTETNGSCSAFDDVIINYYEQPSSNAGPGGIVCGVLNFGLSATPSTGIGTWTLQSGPGTAGFSPSPNSAGATVTVSSIGTYVFKWKEINGICIDSSTVTVDFVNLPIVSYSGLGGPHCISDTVPKPLLGSPIGGVFSGNGIVGNDFFANLALVGSNIITYTYTDGNGCVNTDAQIVTVIGLPSVNFTGLSFSYCEDDGSAYALSGFPAGGIFTGSGISGNSFTPNLAGIGFHTITYTYTDGNGCTNAESQSVIVNALPLVTFSGLASEYCVDISTVILTGIPSGGVFSGNGITGNIFDPSSAGLGTHNITYTYTDGNGCTNDSVKSVLVNSVPTVAFSGLNTTYCIDVGPEVLLGTPLGGTFSGNGISGNTFYPSIAGVGTHSIKYTYTDGNICTDSSIQLVSVTALPIVSFSGLASAYCSSNSSAILAGTPTGGIFSGSGISGNIFYPSFAGVGTHIIKYIYTDGGGCADSTTQTVLVNSDSPFLSVDSVTTTEAACDSTCNAIATVIGSGGVAPYAYQWSNGDVGATADSLCASTFYVTVTDANGCESDNDIIVSGPLGLLSSITDTTMVTTCFGSCVGAATVSGSGGSLPYTYSWVDNNGTPLLGTSASISGLCAGSYYAVVKDQNTCITTAPFTITEPGFLAPTICSIQAATCNSVCDGFATACVSGGTAPFTYLWNDPNAQTTATATGLCADTFRVDITDASGCVTFDSMVVITEPLPLVASIYDTVNTVCDTLSPIGEAKVLGTGGTTPYQYLWNTTPQQTDTLASGLLAGFYSVTVTDNNGCTASDSVNISDTSNMSASITSLTLSSCGGLCDGSAIVTPTGSTVPYAYNWVDSLGLSIGETDSLADTLCAGLYRAIVTSSSYCIRSVPVNTTTPLPVVSFSGLTTPQCTGDTAELLIGLPSGGAFSGLGISGNFFDPQVAGTGTHIIKYVYTDGNGCTDSSMQTVVVNGLGLIAFTGLDTGYCIDASPVVLSGLPPGGVFSGTGMSSSIFDPAIAGVGSHLIVYQYTSFDGCTGSYSQNVNVNPLPTLLITGLNAAYCIDVPDAPLTGTPAGGVFSGNGISGNSFYPFIADTGIHIITYTYTAGTGCTNSISQAVEVTPMPVASFTGLSPSLCVSAANNTLTGSPLGGTFSGNGISGNIFSPSAAGVGTHTIKYFYSDGNGCTDSSGQSVVVMALPAVTFFGLDPEYCVDALTVSLVGFPLGGTFSGPGISGSLFDPGSAGIGTHSVTYSYTDGNGCADSVAQNVIVNALPVPVITPDGDTTFCQGDSVVLNTIVATSYLWSTGDTTSSLTVKSSGSYSVYITDVNACFAMSPSIIVTVNNLPTIVTSSIDVSCNGGSDGIAIGMAFGGVAPYSYQWDSPPVQTNDTATALSAGSYTLVVTDSNGCVDSVAVQVFEPLALSTSTYSSVVSCNGDSDGTASIVVMGGIPSYSYLWDDGNAQTNFTAIGLSSGNYNVTATDANGCIITDSIAVIEPAVLSLSVLETAVSCFNAGDGTAVVTVSGGNPSYTYLWSDGQTSSMAIGLSGGIYTVEVVDFKGCDDEIEATVSEMTELTATTTTIETTLGNSDGQGTVNAFGGAPPYSYEWSDGQIDSVATGLGQGSYNITVTDNDGCTTSEMIEIEVATLDVSTGFTPNGDGTNDLWSIGDMSLYPFVEVTVMNRWGEQIFYSEGYNEPWDGTYKGEVLPMGSYFFIIDLNEGTDPTTGAVTILK